MPPDVWQETALDATCALLLILDYRVPTRASDGLRDSAEEHTTAENNPSGAELARHSRTASFRWCPRSSGRKAYLLK